MMRHIQIVLIVLFFSFCSSINAQRNREKYKDIEKYIPYNLSSYKRFPKKTINVKVHIIQYSKKKIMNIPLKDSGLIYNMISRINYQYSNFENATLKVPSNPPLILSSRLQFKIKKVVSHIDPELFSSAELKESNAYGSPWNIDSIDFLNNYLIVKSRISNLIVEKPTGMDSLIYYDINNEKNYLHFDTSFYKSPYTFIKIRENLSDKGVMKIAYQRVFSSICNTDLFNKYAIDDSSFLHIFLTGDNSKNIAGGCGPSPLYLKLSHFNKSSYKLLGHELGHCLGLYHTNSPQFDDLPLNESFTGPCDSISISNNIMGYNLCRNYLSPKQIGFIYKDYNTNPIKIKTTSDCSYDNSRTLTINRNMIINRNFVYGADVVVKKKKTLEISGKLSLPKGGYIYIEKKANLIINGGIINNACDENWGGIIFVKRYKKKHSKMKITKGKYQLIIENGGKIENLAN